MIAIGIILALVGFVMLLLRPHLSDKTVYEGSQKVSSKAPPFLLMFTKRSSLMLFVSGLFIATLP